MKPEKVNGTLVVAFSNSWIELEPLGVVLIMGSWNYPLMAIIHPLA
jgi:aldehyde dehydrogenase (NAD+)